MPMHRPSLSRRVALALIILALVSVSCGQPSAPVQPTAVGEPTAVEMTPVVKAAQATRTAAPTVEPTVPPTEQPTAEAEPTHQPTKPEPTATQPPDRKIKIYEHMGVGLDLPAELSEDVYGRIETGGYGDATIIGEFGPFPDA